MRDRLVTEVVRGILADPTLVAELRAALAPAEAQGGRIGHAVAAERWGVRPATVAGWCRDGLVDGIKRGNTWLVPPDAERPPRTPRVAPAPAQTPVRRAPRRRGKSVGSALRGA